MKQISITIFVLFLIGLSAAMAHHTGRSSGKPIRTSLKRAVLKNDTSGKKDTVLPKPVGSAKKDTATKLPAVTVKKDTANKKPTDTNKKNSPPDKAMNGAIKPPVTTNVINTDSAARKNELIFNWKTVFKSEPQIRKEFPKYVDSVPDPYLEVQMERRETVIGHCDKLNASARLEIVEISTHKIHGNYTEVENKIQVVPYGFSFVKSDNSDSIEMKINGTGHKIPLDIRTIKKASAFSEIQFRKPLLEFTSHDYLIHTSTIMELKKKSKLKDFNDLKENIQQNYPPVSDSADSWFSPLIKSVHVQPSKDDVLSDVVQINGSTNSQSKKCTVPKGISLIVNGFGGGAYRIVRVNQPLNSGDQFIKERNETETSIGSWGGNLGIGMHMGAHVLAAEYSFLSQGFSSDKTIDWPTGNAKAGNPTRYELKFHGFGLTYYYMPENFLFKFGFYHTWLTDADQFGGYANKRAVIGNMMIGYNHSLTDHCNFYIAPTINYNFTALSRQELKTKLFAYGISAGIRYKLYNKPT